MVKKLANKTTKLLMDESEVKKQQLPKADFSSNWQGRIYVAKPEKSFIAQQMGLKEKGEYAIKVK